MRVAIASDGWTGNRDRSAYTYSRSVLTAARAAGVDAKEYLLPSSYGAKVGGFVLPYVRSQLGRYERADGSVLVHQTTHGARRGVDVATVFDLYAFVVRGGVAGFFRRSAVRASLRRARRVVTLTEAGRREISHAFPQYAEKLRVAPMAFEAPPPSPGAVPRHDALWVGVWDDRKNPAAYLSLVPRFPSRSFAIRVGAHPFPSVPPNLTVLPRLSEEEIDRMYRSVRLLVVTSTVEGFHAPAMEAYLRGARLLLPRIEPFIEIYAPDGRNVFWFDPKGGPEALASAFATAVEAPAQPRSPEVVRSVSYLGVGERLRAIYEEAARH